MITALQNRTVDAAWMVEPFITKASSSWARPS